MPRTVSMALISLTRDEVSRLDGGELRVVGQGESYRETFKALAAQMADFANAARVA